jgi:hypothetical protein
MLLYIYGYCTKLFIADGCRRAVGTRESSLGPKPGVKRGRDERGVSRRMLPGMIRNRGDFPRHSVHHFSAKGGNEFKKDISRPEKQFFSTERHAMYP